MTQALDNLAWHPLAGLRGNFEANIAALAGRNPQLAALLQGHQPSAELFVASTGEQIVIAQRHGDQAVVLPNPVPAALARDLAQKIFPSNVCTAPAMVAGLDQGWLWHALFEIPCTIPALPGHRPPLYLLAHDLERLWIVLHIQQWQKLLADSRSLLFVGPDAVAQARQAMLNDIAVPWPRFCLTVEPQLWAPGLNLDALIADATRHATARLNPAPTLKLMAEAPPTLLPADRPLRVLGITSRYTTFLQHSMRDWLSAFERLGHTTRLLIESADHEILNNVIYTETCASFRPDLIVIIDHYRAEISGLPADVPCVMWVQDNLPNIFSARAGAAQGPLDFCVGFGKYHLSSQFGYPEDRFCPATIGVNDDRFSPEPVERSLFEAHACDLSFVGHASAPAEVLLHEEQQRARSPEVIRLLDDVFQRMRAHYEEGGEVLCAPWIRRIIDASLQGLSLQVDEKHLPGLIELFNQRINNALYRHQTLNWAAGLDVDLRLYGRGWENHPTLGRFARGVADNNTQLRAIYQASRINLQVTPFGAVHQRLLDGLLAGGFFLIRDSRGDRVGLLHRQLWDFCQRHRITTNDQLLAAIDDEIRPIVERIDWLEGHRFGPRVYPPLLETCRLHAESNFLLAADSIWPEFDTVAFDTEQTLRQRVERFLGNESVRRSLTAAMRRPVVERCTYAAITQRLLTFMREKLAAAPLRRSA